MNIFSKLFVTYRKHGLKCAINRTLIHTKLTQLKVFKFFKVSIIKSAYGIKFTANYEDATFKSYISGSYGYWYWNKIQNIEHPFVFLDIGANQGLYCIAAAINKFCSASYAFEPVPQTYQLLLKNLSINKVNNKVSAINKAISNKSGSQNINIVSNHSGAASLAFVRNTLTNQSIRIKLLNFKGLEKEVKINYLPIFCKIDVEGFEPIVIEQLIKTSFFTKIEEIFFEVDERLISADKLSDLIKKLSQHGFTSLKKIGYGKHYDINISR
jgi:FkbM family methyltransferase